MARLVRSHHVLLRKLKLPYDLHQYHSKPFDFVRVDLYLTPRGVRCGELTFTPAAALDNKRLP